jgi:predicted acylesterase/phospholipase RssA
MLLGFYHIGVVKALWTEGLLPRVISGASAGSLVAAQLGKKRVRVRVRVRMGISMRVRVRMRVRVS